MAFQRLSWISTLLCIAQVSSMPTKCQLQRTLVAKTHNLLETMTGPFPLQCLDDSPVEIRSPTWALLSSNSKQDVGAAKAVYKTLMKVSSLMENDGFPQSWDADKLVKFQIIVDRQVEESKCCVKRRFDLLLQIMSIKTQKEEDDFPARDAALTDYFEKLEKLLKEKEFSVCGWEVVRRELLSILQFILVENSNNFWLTV
ncbi:interferon alpha-3-like [Colossoma macropomum]|uniref:interferon alpha-3-like n=1 Tax=Colossoma macropomum TaxID=42526 RepID=UPI00186501EB|nr:interferon alpha-3-like [Colossoma macropomum]